MTTRPLRTAGLRLLTAVCVSAITAVAPGAATPNALSGNGGQFPLLAPPAADDGLRVQARVIAEAPLWKFVQLTTCFHGLDERRWPNSLEVDFSREGLAEHMAFGRGVHKCPGANLARSELRVFLEEWLARIPDFEIKPGGEAVTATGAVAGVLKLPLAWPA